MAQLAKDKLSKCYSTRKVRITGSLHCGKPRGFNCIMQQNPDGFKYFSIKERACSVNWTYYSMHQRQGTDQPAPLCNSFKICDNCYRMPPLSSSSLIFSRSNVSSFSLVIDISEFLAKLVAFSQFLQNYSICSSSETLQKMD